MATQAVKVKNQESQSSAITGAASGVGEKVSDTIKNSSEFLHDVRVEMKQVTWPGREEVTSTTSVVIVTVFFFAAFLAAVDWLAQLGVQRILKIFGV
jgi:preprotein translocase subunit SecE